MVYDYTSSSVAIAMVLGRTRMSDQTYADDILDWLGEGVGFFRLRNALVPCTHKIEIHDHVGSLPCGIVFMDGLYYGGKRLPLGTGSIDTRAGNLKRFQSNFTTYFTNDVTDPAWRNEQDFLLLRGADIKQITSCNPNAYYIPYPKHIQTSFKTGCVYCFYRKMPVDDKGYPLIPNEINAKMAIVWWILSQLTMTGYKLPVASMDYNFCMSEHLRYLADAKSLLKGWSTDKKEAVKNLIVKLIPPAGYYQRFGVGGELPNGYD